MSQRYARQMMQMNQVAQKYKGDYSWVEPPPIKSIDGSNYRLNQQVAIGTLPQGHAPAVKWPTSNTGARRDYGMHPPDLMEFPTGHALGKSITGVYNSLSKIRKELFDGSAEANEEAPVTRTGRSKVTDTEDFSEGSVTPKGGLDDFMNHPPMADLTTRLGYSPGSYIEGGPLGRAGTGAMTAMKNKPSRIKPENISKHYLAATGRTPTGRNMKQTASVVKDKYAVAASDSRRPAPVAPPQEVTRPAPALSEARQKQFEANMKRYEREDSKGNMPWDPSRRSK